MRTNIQNINADFTCKHCGRFVTSLSAISGVVHRNHCPFCLHSRHVDLFGAGDRLCACKSLMSPVGLTLKQSRDKYAPQRGGELMLVHRCMHCGELAINRIAADDDPAMILAILEETDRDLEEIQKKCRAQGIRMLKSTDLHLATTRLFGENGREIYEMRLTHQTI